MTPSDKAEAERRYPDPPRGEDNLRIVIGYRGERAAYIAGREDKDREVKAILRSVLVHFGTDGALKVCNDALAERAALADYCQAQEAIAEDKSEDAPDDDQTMLYAGEAAAYRDVRRVALAASGPAAELQRILDHYDMRTDLYTNDADLAGGMADIARAALASSPPPAPVGELQHVIAYLETWAEDVERATAKRVAIDNSDPDLYSSTITAKELRAAVQYIRMCPPAARASATPEGK